MNNLKKADINAALNWPLGFSHITTVARLDYVNCSFRLRHGPESTTLACQISNICFFDYPRGGSYTMTVFEDGSHSRHLQTVIVRRFIDATNRDFIGKPVINDPRVNTLQPDIVRCLHVIVYVSILIDRCPRTEQEKQASRDWFYEIRRADIDIIEAQIGRPLYQFIRAVNSRLCT